MLWILLGVFALLFVVWFAYNLGYDKGVWQGYYMPNSRKVKNVLEDNESFWNYY